MYLHICRYETRQVRYVVRGYGANVVTGLISWCLAESNIPKERRERRDEKGETREGETRVERRERRDGGGGGVDWGQFLKWAPCGRCEMWGYTIHDTRYTLHVTRYMLHTLHALKVDKKPTSLVLPYVVGTERSTC